MSLTYTKEHTTTGYSSGDVDIQFTFDYLDDGDIKVYQTDTSGTPLVLGTDWQFKNKKEVTLLAASSNYTIAADQKYIVQRQTDVDDAHVTYAPGSSIRAEDLNNNQLQALYSAQEREERALQTTGGTLTGSVNMAVGTTVVFEGATDDAHETTLTVVDPTADRTISLPNVTGTVVTTGDTDTVTTTMVDGSLVNANIAANAEIAVNKLANGTARQVLQTAVNGTDVEFTSNVDLPGTLDVSGATTFDGTVTANTFTGALAGNATTSTTLATARNIGGVSFNGGANINLPGVNAAGNQNTSGNAATATALANARTIAGQSFDGTANITIAPTDLTDVTASANEINQLDGIDLIPTSPTWTSATEIPSNSQISDRIAELGGFEAIADEDSFPATAPPEGVVVSISNANALSVSAGGVGAGTRAGGSDAVVINGFPTEFNSTTLDNGIGLLVVSTSTAHTYDFHRVVAKNEDVRQLSSDIDDFKARYRVGSTTPSDGLCGINGTGTGSRPCNGDLFYNTASNSLLVYDAGTNTTDTDSAVQALFTEVQSVGEYFIIPAAELADFASGSASVETISNAPNNAEQIVLSINGVIQEPNAGTAVPTDGFSLNGAVIQLAATPPASSDVWGVIIGSTVNINEPSANSVSTVKIQDDAVTYAKMQDIATGNRVLGRASAGEIQEVQVATDMIADDAVTYAKMQHTATANRLLGAAAAGAIGETQVQSAMIIDDVALGGNPTTTTQTAGNNTTRVATTAFVTTAVGAVNTDVVNDTSPQLGGNLDVNGNQIVSASNGDISIQPNGTGTVEVKRASSALNTLTDAATIAVDLSLANNHTVTLGDNRTLGNPTNAEPGQTGSIFIVQDGTGSRTLTPAANWHFAKGGAHPTFSTAANAVDRIDYIVRTSTSIHCVATFNYS